MSQAVFQVLPCVTSFKLHNNATRQTLELFPPFQMDKQGHKLSNATVGTHIQASDSWLVHWWHFQVFLFSHSWSPQLPSHLFQEPSFYLSWSECVYVHCTQMFPQTQAFFLHPLPYNRSMNLNVHLWNVLSPNPTWKPWFSGIHGSLICSFPSYHIGRC